MQKNTKKKIGVIALILILLICLYFVASTYALYASEFESDSTVEVAAWSVKVGNVSGTADSTESFDLTLSTDSSAYVSEGKIAPSTTASGEFTIDPSGSEVAIKYEISTGDISYDGSATGGTFEVSNVAVAYSSTTTDTYTVDYDMNEGYGILGLTDVEAGITLTVTVTVEWTSANLTSTDTPYGLESAVSTTTLTIPVTVTATQYTGA